MIVDWSSQGKAIDFYFSRGVTTARELLDLSLRILKFTGWGGLGLYPDWKPLPGFHIDTRSESHSDYRAWWIGYKDESGEQKYIYNPNFSVLETLVERGLQPNGRYW